MKIEKLRNPYVRGNEGCSVSMIDLLEKINEIIDAMNGEHDPADIYSEDGRLIAKKDESEDERIRKEAISIVQSYMNICDKEGDPCLSGYKVLAWLEKQKEQKPAWSEEDEKIMQTMIKEGDLKPSEIAWLKSLRPQPKQEWSEDDEKMLEQVVDVVYDYCPDPVAKYKLKDWLNLRFKSIRPCPSWKPSEEQMDALQHAIDACESEWAYQDDELRSLLNGLKKL